MPKESNSAFSSGEVGADSPSFSEVLFQNERTMWWAEFDSIGERLVRSNVNSNSYTPTGMEAARQWLARREAPQLRGDVQAITALAENVQRTASDFLRGELEESTLASRVDANTRAIVEIAANAKKNARATIFIGVATSFFSLCAMVMVLASSRQVTPNTNKASAQPARPNQAAVRPMFPTIAPAETRQVAPNRTQAAAQPSRPAQAIARPLAPTVSPAESRQVAPSTKHASAQPSRPTRAVIRPAPPAVPRAQTGQASAIQSEAAQEERPSGLPQIESPDLRPEGQSLAQALALIADRVEGEGTINFTARFHDMATGRDYAEQLSYKTSNVTIDPNRCQLGYFWHVEQDGRAVSDHYRTVELRLAKSIRVASIDVESGRRLSMRAYPKVYVLHIARWNNSSGDDLYFHDRDKAERVGTAARRAIELCKNGEQQFRFR